MAQTTLYATHYTEKSLYWTFFGTFSIAPRRAFLRVAKRNSHDVPSRSATATWITKSGCPLLSFPFRLANNVTPPVGWAGHRVLDSRTGRAPQRISFFSEAAATDRISEWWFQHQARRRIGIALSRREGQGLFGKDFASLEAASWLSGLQNTALTQTRAVQCVGMHKPVPFDDIYQPTTLVIKGVPQKRQETYAYEIG
jgi:hypothetical protein